LVIVVVVLLVVGLTWRARTTRRLTVEESVDRYRRTLSAVHEAAARSRTTEGESRPMRFDPGRRRSTRYVAPDTRRRLAVAAMAIATVAAVGIVIAQNRGKEPRRRAAATTTRPPSTHPTTTTTRPAATTTTVPLVSASGGSGTAFTVSKASYTLVVQTTNGACWIDARDPTGASLFSGTLSAGQSQSITAGAVTLRLGNPAAVALSIDGTAVPVALAGGSPVTLQFQGTAT
jgi:cytoskeletal protein RodZ